jgi:glutathione synthase/RimK-type ligase-like ATP-grasp enzyme
MSKFVFTLAEDEAKTTESHFAVKYSVDENDCYDFADGLKALGHDVYFVNWADLGDQSGEFTRMFHDNTKRFIAPLSLSKFDLGFVYKMEGFLFNLPRFMQMVSRFEKACGVVVNQPDTIRHNIDKHYLFQLGALGIRVPETFQLSNETEALLSQGRKFVIKPWCAERGFGATLAQKPEDLANVSGPHFDYMAQEYLPEIRDGERSLVFLGFEFQHAVLKKPQASNPNEFRCNESLGGTVAVYKPSQSELQFAVSVLRTYSSLGYQVHFSRIDFVNGDRGPILIEAELLNPSIYASYSNLGAEFGARLADYFDALVGSRKLATRS